MEKMNFDEMSFKELRRKMGLTITQVSTIYSIPYSTVQKWEYGKNKPAGYILMMMWELYDVIYKDSM